MIPELQKSKKEKAIVKNHNKKALRIFNFAVGIYLLFFCGIVNAELIDFGHVTKDTETGLYWLDLTASLNRSFNDVSSQFGIGGDFEGYRYATEAELLTFWTNAGIPDINNMPFGSVANFLPIQSLQSMVGLTFTTTHISRSFGVIDADYVSPIFGDTFKRVPYLEIDPTEGTGIATLSDFGVTSPSSSVRPEQNIPGATSGPHGHWLVSTAVPIPNSAWLFASGIIWLAGMTQRRRVL